MRYVWGNNAKRATMKGRACRVIARGRMNSVLIQFLDTGQREIVSRRALREPMPDFNPRVDYPERYMQDGVWSI